MTWNALSFPFASKLTSTKMTQLQANFTALSDNDTGAPTIKGSAMRISAESMDGGSGLLEFPQNSLYIFPRGFWHLTGIPDSSYGGHKAQFIVADNDTPIFTGQGHLTRVESRAAGDLDLYHSFSFFSDGSHFGLNCGSWGQNIWANGYWWE